MLIPHIIVKGIQAPADGLASRRTVGKAGAEAKLGPESSIPFIMLYLTVGVELCPTPLSENLAQKMVRWLVGWLVILLQISVAMMYIKLINL